MKRNEFIKKTALAGLSFGLAMEMKDLFKDWQAGKQGQRMPVLFVGHGNPMNAILQNDFSNRWRSLAKELPKPKAILVISAHWETEGTLATAMEKPRTIHDFGGFPQELFDQQYPAPGSPYWAEETKKMLKSQELILDHQWGLDHGTWSVLKPMYPEADIPVYQMSINYRLNPSQHYQLASELKALREKGILIVGSGNIVHNLRMVNWNASGAYDWAQEFDAKVYQLIQSGEHKSLIDYQSLGKAAQLSVPSNEHYIPLLYSLGLTDTKDEIRVFNKEFDLASVSMTSYVFA